MGLGEFLRGSADFFAKAMNPVAAIGVGAAEQVAQIREAEAHPSFFKQAALGAKAGLQSGMEPGITAVTPVVKAAEAVPGGKFLMDLPSRSWDTLFITAAHAGSVSADHGGLDSVAWGQLTDTDVWSKAWNSWGQEGHTTAGQLFASRLTAADEDGIKNADPLAALDAKAIQNGANETWYGEMMGGATDLAFSMMMPGAGVATGAVKAGRAAKTIESGVEAEKIATRFAETGGEGAQISRAGDIADNLLSRPKNTDSMIGRMVSSMEKTDGVHDIDSMLAHLSPMMENSSDSAKVMLADILTQANKVEDPALRSQVKVNAMLAAHGSGTAREALVRDFPLLAKNLENMTGSPRDIALAEELLNARLSGGADVDDTINGVLSRHYSRPSDQAELDALRDAVDKAAIDAKTARGLWKETRAGSDERLAAEDLLAETAGELDVAKGFAKSKKAEIRAKSKDAERYRPGLNRANDLLNEILLLGDDSVAVGRVAPTALDSVKTKLRLMAGDEMEMRFGDGNTPVIVKSLPSRVARFAMAPQARGSISLIETDLGQRQLADALKRSGVYGLDEAKAAQQELLLTPPAKRQTVIANHQQQMLERIAMKHFGDDRTPEEALAYAKQITQAAIRNWGQGNEWVVKAAGEQKGKGKVIVRTPDGNAVVYDEAMLQSQLADNAPFLDPEVFEKAIVAHKDGIKNNLQAKADALVGLNDAATALWKHGALLRPGLAVRAALDTEMRALALLSTAETFMAAMDGAANIMRNRRSAVSRVLLGDGDIAEGAVRRLSLDMKPVTVEVGGGRKVTTAFSRSADERTANQMAMTKGADSPWKFYFTETQRHLSRFRTDRAKWARNKADSPHWVSSYLEYAEQLLASPTARWLAKNKDETTDLSDLMDSPEFKAEFSKVAQPKGYTRWEFARQVMHEVDMMFPDGDLVDAVQSHRLTPKMVESKFPRTARFDVPGPDRSAIGTPSVTEKANEILGRAYRTLLDKPDMWLSRNPTGSMLYRRALAKEADALRRAYPDGDIPERMLAVMDKRARAEAIGTVRRTFFDTTRHTSLHQKAARISPFFAAWEDAMISWSRLIHDDPRRLVKLGAAYNAAGTLNPYLPQPLLVDNDGKPLRRGQEHDNGAYLALPFKVKGVQMRVRMEALNSIAQGETWWLPGFGPQATVATSQILGRFVPPEVMLDIVGTDHWLGKQVLNSMFLDGELPRTDLGTTAASLMPSTVRNVVRDAFGDNFAMNVQRNANYRIAQAQKQGKRLNDSDLNKIYDEAAKTAYVAATVRAISGGGFGMTGTATVDGQFYVEQMRTIEAMKPESLKSMGFNSPEEYFAHLHPEAADLDWHVSKNESGVRASVNAAKSSSRLGGVLKDHPDDVGWMVLGRDNLNIEGGDDFSRTVYGMQQSSGARKKMSAEEIEAEGRAAVGWKKYRSMQTDLELAAEELGLPVSHPALADTKRQYVDMLMQQNSAWAAEWTKREDRFQYNLSQARALASDRRLADRSDMVAFRDYDAARQEVMAEMGLSSLSGTGAESMAAKATIREVGETLAKRDFGFQQMWDRFLSREVEDAPAGKTAEPVPTEPRAGWVSA